MSEAHNVEVLMPENDEVNEYGRLPSDVLAVTSAPTIFVSKVLDSLILCSYECDNCGANFPFTARPDPDFCPTCGVEFGDVEEYSPEGGE